MPNKFDNLLETIDKKIIHLKRISKYLSQYFRNERYESLPDRLIKIYSDKREQLMVSELSDSVKIEKMHNTELMINEIVDRYQLKKEKLDDADKLKVEAEEKCNLTIKSMFVWELFLELHEACINAIKYDNITLLDICYEKYESVYNEMMSMRQEMHNRQEEKTRSVLYHTQSMLSDEKQNLLSPKQEEKVRNIQIKYESTLKKMEHVELLNTIVDNSTLDNIEIESNRSAFQLKILRKLDHCITQVHNQNSHFSVNNDLISEWVEKESIGDNFNTIINNITK